MEVSSLFCEVFDKSVFLMLRGLWQVCERKLSDATQTRRGEIKWMFRTSKQMMCDVARRRESHGGLEG